MSRGYPAPGCLNPGISTRLASGGTPHSLAELQAVSASVSHFPTVFKCAGKPGPTAAFARFCRRASDSGAMGYPSFGRIGLVLAAVVILAACGARPSKPSAGTAESVVNNLTYAWSPL